MFRFASSLSLIVVWYGNDMQIVCRRATQVDETIDSLTLYSLLSSSLELSKRNIAMILEQVQPLLWIFPLHRNFMIFLLPFV